MHCARPRLQLAVRQVSPVWHCNNWPPVLCRMSVTISWWQTQSAGTEDTLRCGMWRTVWPRDEEGGPGLVQAQTRVFVWHLLQLTVLYVEVLVSLRPDTAAALWWHKPKQKYKLLLNLLHLMTGVAVLMWIKTCKCENLRLQING